MFFLIRETAQQPCPILNTPFGTEIEGLMRDIELRSVKMRYSARSAARQYRSYFLILDLSSRSANFQLIRDFAEAL
jgi:hypothetical protein